MVGEQVGIFPACSATVGMYISYCRFTTAHMQTPNAAALQAKPGTAKFRHALCWQMQDQILAAGFRGNVESAPHMCIVLKILAYLLSSFDLLRFCAAL